MTLRKSNTYLSLVNSYLIDSPQPSSINYWWNVGSLLGLCLVIQLASGIFLAMHYSSNIELAFNSVEHIMRDVNAGWLIRYIHANGASFFFICLYLHIGKALYYGSYRSPRVLLWTIGVIIFILTMATAFMGYILNSPKSFYKILYWSPKATWRLCRQFYSKVNKLFARNTGMSTLPVSSITRGFNLQQVRFKSKKTFIENNNVAKNNWITSRANTTDITDPNLILNEIGLKVVKVWDSLDKRETCLNILNEVKNKSGIYLICNKITRNMYVGSASTNKLYTRYRNHLYNKKGSKLVKKSIEKYGLNNFFYAVIEYYPEIINRYNNKELLKLETYYISLLTPSYNILTEAGNSFGYKHSEEVLLKMKENYPESNRIRLREWQLSRKNNWTLEERNKLRDIALNRPKDYISIETRNNISLKKSLNINLYLNNYSHNDSTSQLLCNINNINKLANLLCVSYKTIQRAINLGYIYVPNSFIPYLNNNHIDNNDNIISFVRKANQSTISSDDKNKFKSRLINLPSHTIIYLKSNGRNLYLPNKSPA